MSRSTSMSGHQSAAAQTDTWLTPPDLIKALGPFDMDPCCPPIMPWRTALRMLHAGADDGLKSEWLGRVWLNPPFGPRPLVRSFMQRMAQHGCGTALLAARTETDLFFETVWTKASALLFLRGRPHFHYPDGRRARANSGAPIVLIAYGFLDAKILKTCILSGHYVPPNRDAS